MDADEEFENGYIGGLEAGHWCGYEKAVADCIEIIKRENEKQSIQDLNELIKIIEEELAL